MYKVFVVDDEIVVREGIRNSIHWEETQYSLAGEAPDGEMALSMIQDIKPDILIADIRMPFLDGLTLSRIVKKSFPWIKIIILSGHDEFDYAREAISIGVDEYLLKPVSSGDMLKALDKIAKRINDEREYLLSIGNLKARIADSSLLPPSDGRQNLVKFPEIDGNLFFTRLCYAKKKDIDAIIAEYTKHLENDFDEMTAYLIFGEVVIAASKIIEDLGGDIKEIIPFNIDKASIRSLISSRSVFFERLASLLASVIEYRNSHTEGRYRAVIVKAREYINKNYSSGDISLFSTASYVGISPSHLSTVFAQETGENFVEYLTRIRIEKAKQLLSKTAMKSAEIAIETGFNDPHYFSNIFKKNTGFSPREFRFLQNKKELHEYS